MNRTLLPPLTIILLISYQYARLSTKKAHRFSDELLILLNSIDLPRVLPLH
ncbi:hypothetical protein JCM19046_2163 [Bacillus sp. JCM 19046]|nr:hypothetical protein JCM19046_2163 [Bacillus sp. JCM 19046]